MLLVDEMRGAKVSVEKGLNAVETHFDGAVAVGDWFQFSLGGSANGTSVFRSGLSAEIMPEFEYSAWRPRGFATLGIAVGSPDNDTTVGLGLTFLKELSLLSLNLSPEAHVAAAQRSAVSDKAASPGASVALGASRAFGAWTPRVDLTYRHLASRSVTTGGIARETDPINDVRLGAGLSFMAAEHVALSLSVGAQVYSSVLGASDLDRRVAFALRVTEGR